MWQGAKSFRKFHLNLGKAEEVWQKSTPRHLNFFLIGVYHFFNGHKIYWSIRCERTPKIFFVECFTVESSLILLVYLDFLQHLTRISEYLFYRKK